MYQLELSRRANHVFQKLPLNDFERVATILRRLTEEPRPLGVKKLKPGIYRVRSGDWRIIYRINDKEQRIAVAKITRRSEDTYDRVEDLF